MEDSKLARTKIIIITDAWRPQVNGVVTTYENIINNLPEDVSIEVVHPGLFKNIPSPGYKEVRLAFCSYKAMEKLLIKNEPDTYYHIATEGVLGFQARRVLREHKIKYTSAYHTKFPEFFNMMYKVPVWVTKWYFDWFHSDSKVVMCSSLSSKLENPKWNAQVLSKGYDSHFKFVDKKSTQVKTLLYVGRVSKEKNIEKFCELDIPDTTKIVVGDGPARKCLEKKYPNVNFVGYKFGEELARYYQRADVFVFPSKVDTFGIVILESMACGTPVAGYNVTGPKDQIINGINGYIDNNLETAVKKCLNISRYDTYHTVYNINWKQSSIDFIRYVTK
jgi:glycosyltransferase involved in cell wall biosynthesis